MEQVRALLSDADWARFRAWCDGRHLEQVDHAVGYVLGYGRLPRDLDLLAPTRHPEPVPNLRIMRGNGLG